VGDLLAHSLFEAIYFGLLVTSGYYLHGMYKEAPKGPYFFWAVGFYAASAVTFFHILLPWAFPELKSVWVPVTWFVERFLLWGSLLFGMINILTGNKINSKWAYSILVAAGLLLGASFLLEFPWSSRGGMFIFGEEVLRLLDGLLLPPIVVIGVLALTPKIRPYVPDGFNWLIALGITVHGIMMMLSGKTETFDDWFFIAHFLKVVECVTFTMGVAHSYDRLKQGRGIKGSELTMYGRSQWQPLKS